nr:hypothetical protein [uncultured Mucilaginibacter sp.]
MKKIKFMGALLIALITLGFTTSSSANRFGLDYYEFYLNNKLLAKQYVNQPLNLRVLPLDKAKEDDQLQIAYTHCGNKGTGTSRSITLKDELGETLFKWTFADAGQRMTVPVKELLHWQKKKAGHELSLYYAAHELEKGEMLSMIRFK